MFWVFFVENKKNGKGIISFSVLDLGALNWLKTPEFRFL
jgi:hypothetical protein